MQINIHKPEKQLRKIAKGRGRAYVLSQGIDLNRSSTNLMFMAKEYLEYIAWVVQQKTKNKKCRVKVSTPEHDCYFKFDKSDTCDLYKVVWHKPRNPVDWTNKQKFELKILANKKDNGDVTFKESSKKRKKKKES